MSASGLRRWLVAALAVFVLGIAAASVLSLRLLDRGGPVAIDHAFDVAIFYCAARAVGHGDPYALEPLATCERRFPAVFKDSIAPAPQPEYLLALLAPFARNDELRFAFAWLTTLAALAVASAALLARVSGFSPWALLIGLGLGPGLVNFELGQFSFAVVAGVAAAALALRRERPALAALALVPALAEPHVALPAYASLFVLAPPARAAIAAVAVVALGASLASFGAGVTGEYFTRELPLQALAETRNFDQYSLTLLAAAAGASDALAVRLGTVQYFALAVAAIFVARRLRRRYGDASFVVVVPAAAAVVGGTFIHYSELLALWPALAVLASHATGRVRGAALGIAIVLADPWEGGFSNAFTVLALSAMAWLAASDVRPAARAALIAAWLVPATAYAVFAQRAASHVVYRFGPSRDFLAEAPWGAGLAPIAWGRHVRLDHTTLLLAQALAKVPVVVALAALVALTIAVSRSPAVSAVLEPT